MARDGYISVSIIPTSIPIVSGENILVQCLIVSIEDQTWDCCSQEKKKASDYGSLAK